MRRIFPGSMAFALCLWTTVEASAFELKAAGIGIVGTTVRATLHLRDAFPPKFRRLIEEGSTIYLRVEAELWENRPVWDRLVGPSRVTAFRIARGSQGQIITALDISHGVETSFASWPQPLSIRVDVAGANRIQDRDSYYLHAIATLGTIAEREVEQVGDAVFGRDSDTSGLGSMGKFLFRKMLQISDYLQSISAEATSRKMKGEEIRRSAGGV